MNKRAWLVHMGMDQNDTQEVFMDSNMGYAEVYMELITKHDFPYNITLERIA